MLNADIADMHDNLMIIIIRLLHIAVTKAYKPRENQNTQLF